MTGLALIAVVTFVLIPPYGICALFFWAWWGVYAPGYRWWHIWFWPYFALRGSCGTQKPETF